MALPRGGSAAVRSRLYNLITCPEVAGGTAAYRLPGKAGFFSLWSLNNNQTHHNGEKSSFPSFMPRNFL